MKKRSFNEATRVQIPTLVHLTRLGYDYFGKINEEMSGVDYDPDTNILIQVFKKPFVALNRQKLDGRVYHSYEELKTAIVEYTVYYNEHRIKKTLG